MCRALGLCVRRRKRRNIRTGIPRDLTPTGQNQVRAYDFVFDTCANDPKMKVLTAVDEWMGEYLAIEVASLLNASQVIPVLENLFERHGAPSTLRSDNGPEFIARALKILVLRNHSETATIAPGKPWQNGTVESFNGTLRGEKLEVEFKRSDVEVHPNTPERLT